jgi:hypothetical protein
MFARKAVLAVAVLFTATHFSAAVAQDRPADYAAAIQANCSKELKSQCKSVSAGRGRLLACLYAYESKLSARCGNVVMGSIDRLGEALTALANVRRVCQGDADRLCHGVVAGDGNLIGCLTQARKVVSSQCNATLDAAFLRP